MGEGEVEGTQPLCIFSLPFRGAQDDHFGSECLADCPPYGLAHPIPPLQACDTCRRQWRSGEYVVIPAHKSGAAPAGDRVEGPAARNSHPRQCAGITALRRPAIFVAAAVSEEYAVSQYCSNPSRRQGRFGRNPLSSRRRPSRPHWNCLTALPTLLLCQQFHVPAPWEKSSPPFITGLVNIRMADATVSDREFAQFLGADLAPFELKMVAGEPWQSSRHSLGSIAWLSVLLLEGPGSTVTISRRP